MSEERVVAPEARSEDGAEVSLRPQTLDEFIGQPVICENLHIFVEAARSRGEALDHVLFYGPPGLGKTTLAQIVARELGVGFRATSGPVIARAGDLAAILTNLNARDVLFIDEIHRLNPAVEEILYPALEDRQLDLIIGEGPAARSVRIDLVPFTLVGATTRTGLVTTPLRERFGIPLRLDFYGAARRASPYACCAACAISPPSPGPRMWTRNWPTGRWSGSRSTRKVSIRSTCATCAVSGRITAAVRSASKPSPRRSRSSAMRSKR